MRKLGLVLATLTALIAGGSASALAAPVGPDNGVRGAVADLYLIEKAQYVWGGRRYCWYANGWSGPGWYYCGYAWRRGYGWGGPYGWRGWYGPRGYGGYGYGPGPYRGYYRW